MGGLRDQRFNGNDGVVIAGGDGTPVTERFPFEPNRVGALASWP
jgi:predicted regulator of Ras-like GTPase activity (Roadblock/LC7/MglB family)